MIEARKYILIIMMVLCSLSCENRYNRILKVWTSMDIDGEVHFICVPISHQDSIYTICSSAHDIYLNLNLKILDKKDFYNLLYQHIVYSDPIKVEEDFFIHVKQCGLVKPIPFIDHLYEKGGVEDLKKYIKANWQKYSQFNDVEELNYLVYHLWCNKILFCWDLEENSYCIIE